MGLEGAEQDFRLVCTVYAGLDHLLEHAVDWSRSKVVRQMLHRLPVEVGAAVSMFIHVYTNCNSTWDREHTGCLMVALNMCNRPPGAVSKSGSEPVETTELWLRGPSWETWMLGT